MKKRWIIGGFLSLALIGAAMDDKQPPVAEEHAQPQVADKTAPPPVEKRKAKLDERTSCSEAVGVFDSDSPDREKVFEVGIFIKAALLVMDQRRVRSGRNAIYMRHTDEGQNGDMAVVLGYCRKNPSATVLSQAIEAYAGLEAIERLMIGQ